MERIFTTSGPIKPDKHYHIPLLTRVDWDEVRTLIRNERYFVLHAPRQTGKTSTLLAIMEELNREGEYASVYANIEGAQAARGNVQRGIAAVCSAIGRSIRLYQGDIRMVDWLRNIGPSIPEEDLLIQMLEQWSMESKKPCVLLLDEVDALVGDTLISVLRQIRSGYGQRPAAFPLSIILCGVRDVRDYRMQQPGGEVITGGSAFNIKARSLRMGNFSREETGQLLKQHTKETGQPFAENIFPELWEDTKGQPWMVNALAHEMVWEDRTARDRSVVIDLPRYMAARERLILSRATHLDQLADKLREERVQRVLQGVLSGEDPQGEHPEISPDDHQYVEDLGLIVTRPWLQIANRIYREIIPRELTFTVQTRILPEQSGTWYLTRDHRLDMPKLLTAFQQFFREHSESWVERFDYKEAGPQLLMQAFLQRIINGGGRLHREYGLGRKRTDLLIEWPLDPDQGLFGPTQRVVIELKLLRGRLETILPLALEQTAAYADTVGAEESHLVIFDRRPEVAWEEKIRHRKEHWGQREIPVWGC